MSEYSAIKNLLTEQNVAYTDDGIKAQAVIPMKYAEKFTAYIRERHEI